LLNDYKPQRLEIGFAHVLLFRVGSVSPGCYRPY